MPLHGICGHNECQSVTQKLIVLLTWKGEGFDCDDVIMLIYFWILGGFGHDDDWWQEGGGGKKCRTIDDVICEWPLKEAHAYI